jgi:F-type H+-transporting ATPase subunit epsilon
MNEQLQLKVVTPSGSLFDLEVTSLTASSERGEFCVLPGHCLILSSIVPGRMIVEQADGEIQSYIIDRGFLEGGPDHMSVITERCVKFDEIDAVEVGAEVSQLEKQLGDLQEDNSQRKDVLLALDWARARLTATENTSI